MDLLVIKDTRDTFDVCIKLVAAIVAKVEVAIRVTADMTKAIDRFLTLVNTTDQRTAVEAIKRGQRKDVRTPRP